MLNTTEERSRGSIAEATCLQGGADDDVNGLLIGALTRLVARQSAVPDDVNGLLIAALTGLVARQSAPIGRGSEALLHVLALHVMPDRAS